jgi:hypothetical protein
MSEDETPALHDGGVRLILSRLDSIDARLTSPGDELDQLDKVEDEIFGLRRPTRTSRTPAFKKKL